MTAHQIRQHVSMSLLVLSGVGLHASCTRPGNDVSAASRLLSAGDWRGDVWPSDGAPFGAVFRVRPSDTGLSIDMSSQYIDQQFTDVIRIDDSLRFTWPMRTDRRCELAWRDDQSWRGDCSAVGSTTISLMLVPPSKPETPTGIARAAYQNGTQWIEAHDGNVNILVQPGGDAAKHTDVLRRSAVAAFNGAFELLNETPPDVPFWFIYVNSRADMTKLVGWPAGGWADGVSRTAVHTVTEGGAAPDRHEIMHVAATVAWGIPAAPWEWINEGLATYAAGECAGAGIHAIAVAIAGDTTAPTVPRLINNFTEVGEVNAYLLSGSLVGYIHEVFGIGAVRAMWQGGAAVIPEVTGRDITSLERDWRAFLARYPAATAELAAARTRGCM